jgi:hypothetical protein
MKTLVAALALTSLATVAVAEPIVYQPPRFQYGAHGEVFYGGVNPQYLPTSFPVPNTPATQALADRFGFPNPNYRLNALNTTFERQFPPLVYSDLFPYDEAGRHGFTIDDARNEAYLNAPRFYAGPASEAARAATDSAHSAARVYQPVVLTPAQQRARATPLLSWARQESARRNPELQRALLWEAAKYDPDAAARVRAELGQ